MTIGVAGYEALLPKELPSEVINVALEFIHTLLEDSKQHATYDTILCIAKAARGNSSNNTVRVSRTRRIGSIILPEAIAKIPLLVVRDKAVPAIIH